MSRPSYTVTQKNRTSSDADELGFSLFTGETYDRATGAFGIGYQSTYPESLARNIVAADLSAFLGVSFRTAQKYLKPEPYTRKDRFDSEYQRLLTGKIDDYVQLLIEINQSREAHVGEVIADSGFMSALSIWKEAFKLADRGTLFEVMSLARLSLETLAWVNLAASIDDVTKLLKLKAQSSIGSLKGRIDFAGRLYGWLSEHAHWYPEAHSKSFYDDGRFLTITHSIDYKVQSYSALTLVGYCFETIIHSMICARGGSMVPPEKGDYSQKLETLRNVVVNLVDDQYGALSTLEEHRLMLDQS